MEKGIEFKPFGKIPRLSKEIVITEKLDGTNAQIVIAEDGQFLTASRNRWITPEDDNYGFSRWANENKEELLKLGIGRHFGEWVNKKIKDYGTTRKFVLFNVGRWNEENKPSCCDIVPVLWSGDFDTEMINSVLSVLDTKGSAYALKYTDKLVKAEGIIVYHTASKQLYKKTIEHDKGKFTS